MSLNPFSKKKKKKHIAIEKGHREPIVVKIFKEKDSENRTHVSIDEQKNGDASVGGDEAGKQQKRNFERNLKDTQGNNNLENAAGEQGQKKSLKRARFVPNDKYFTITVYAVMALFVVVLFAILLTKITPVLDAVKTFLHVLSPFIIGAIIAFVLTPIVNFLDASLFEKTMKIKKPKVRAGLSVALTYIVFLGLLVLAMMKLIPEVTDSISELIDKSKKIYSSLSTTPGTDEIVSSVSNDSDGKIDIDAILNNIKENGVSGLVDEVKKVIPSFVATMNIGEKLTTAVSGTFRWLKSLVTSLINVLLGIAVSIYMVCDKRRIAAAATKLVYCIFKPKTAERVITNSKESFQIFIGFIIGKSIDSLIIGILTFFVLLIFGLPYELLVAVIVGVTNMIPFFGPLIGAIPGVLLYLCIDPVYALIFTGIILAIQQFDGWILGPMILGDSTGVRPIWVIFGITVGGAYFGFIGMFLGVPFTAVIVYLVNKVVDKKLNEKHIEVQ